MKYSQRQIPLVSPVTGTEAVLPMVFAPRGAGTPGIYPCLSSEGILRQGRRGFEKLDVDFLPFFYFALIVEALRVVRTRTSQSQK